jgi:hypothetical protein
MNELRWIAVPAIVARFVSPAGVEFDTWDNGVWVGDPNASQVGIDLNGSVFSLQT